jgi:hypothetical protein
VLADDGDAAGPWGTVYARDYTNGRAVLNVIGTEELKRTHFDAGHNEPDWRRIIREAGEAVRALSDGKLRFSRRWAGPLFYSVR